MLIVTFIRYPMHLHDHPSFLIQHKGFKREARYCPSRGLLPQRPWSGSQAENVQMYRFALSDFMGFLRHRWKTLNNICGAGSRDSGLPRCIIQCSPHPAIPWQVAPQQSLPLFHRTRKTGQGVNCPSPNYTNLNGVESALVQITVSTA